MTDDELSELGKAWAVQRGVEAECPLTRPEIAAIAAAFVAGARAERERAEDKGAA